MFTMLEHYLSRILLFYFISKLSKVINVILDFNDNILIYYLSNI